MTRCYAFVDLAVVGHPGECERCVRHSDHPEDTHVWVSVTPAPGRKQVIIWDDEGWTMAYDMHPVSSRTPAQLVPICACGHSSFQHEYDDVNGYGTCNESDCKCTVMTKCRS